MSKVKCPECHESFPGTDRFGHCAVCHETFVGLGAFDAHRTGEHGTPSRRCELTDKHWRDERGFWHIGARIEKNEKGWWEK